MRTARSNRSGLRVVLRAPQDTCIFPIAQGSCSTPRGCLYVSSALENIWPSYQFPLVPIRAFRLTPASYVLFPGFAWLAAMTDLPRSPFSAADSQLGAFYQYHYALLLMVRSLHHDPAVQVCIEGDDDITLVSARFEGAAVQTKRRTGSKKNLTDASEDLWGTLRIWADGVRRGVFDPAALQFYLVTTSRAPDGSVAGLLRPDVSRDPETALRRLEAIASRGSSEANAPAFAEFQDLPADLRRALVRAVYVVDESPDLADLERLITRELGFPAPARHLASFVRDLEGWWLMRVRRHLEAPPGDVIDGFEVLSWIDELREQYKRTNLPTPFERIHPPDEFFQSAARHTFVRQLGLIDLSPEQVRHAIQDYYRASEQRSRWVRDQLLHLHDTTEYEERLLEEWEREFAAMVRRLRKTDDPEEMVDAGVEFYSHMHRLDIRIRQDCTARFVMRGSLHRLADEPCIGWHAHWEESFENSRKREGAG